MSKDTVTTVDGRDVVVREDTAKAYRAVNWTWLSIGAFILIIAIVAATFLFKAAGDGSVQSPAQIGDSTRH
jgi:hypothetical protein